MLSSPVYPSFTHLVHLKLPLPSGPQPSSHVPGLPAACCFSEIQCKDAEALSCFHAELGSSAQLICCCRLLAALKPRRACRSEEREREDGGRSSRGEEVLPFGQ
ncbi:hypothetical protein AMECASPLE_014631 [Ameca splendens]|uniref:Uncharacterized protein n=1 Tax=Ameca splendens TaxID=208324 RepID=A0ABV0Y230_9TELE